MADTPRRLGKNPWGVRLGEGDEAVLEVWVEVGGSGLDHCFTAGRLPWSSDEVRSQLRSVVLEFIDDKRASKPTAFVMAHVGLESGGCGGGPGRNASSSEQRPRFELLNEALRVLDLPTTMKTSADH